jgi:hypothetical protein
MPTKTSDIFKNTPQQFLNFQERFFREWAQVFASSCKFSLHLFFRFVFFVFVLFLKFFFNLFYFGTLRDNQKYSKPCAYRLRLLTLSRTIENKEAKIIANCGVSENKCVGLVFVYSNRIRCDELRN